MPKKRSSAFAKNSSRIHLSKSSISFQPTPLAKKIIFAVLVLVSLSVVVALTSPFIFTNENLLKNEISSLASDYYENFFYDKSYKDTPEEKLPSIMERFLITGFSSVSLRQLLYSTENTNSDLSNFVLSHCDENSTYVKFYPLSPYSKTDYRVEYFYSCDF